MRHRRACHLRFGSTADFKVSLADVRFIPESGQIADIPVCLLCAKSRHSHCSKFTRSPRRRAAEKTKARRSLVPSRFSYSERVRTSSVVQRASQTASYPVESCEREWRCAGICRVYQRHMKSTLQLPRIDGLPKLWADGILTPAQ